MSESNSFKGKPGSVITDPARVPGDLMIGVQVEGQGERQYNRGHKTRNSLTE